MALPLATFSSITPSPLPALHSYRVEKSRLSERPQRLSAYTMVLQAETNAVKRDQTMQIMSARIVGYFLLEFHEQSEKISDAACACLTLWITSPPRVKDDTDDDVIYRLGTNLREKFIRMFRTSNTRYPPPSSHPSRGSFETLEDMIKDTLEPTDKDHRTPRQKVLARDGYRCMVTGMLNESSVLHCQDLINDVTRGNTCTTTIEMAHILNESTMQGIDPEEKGQPSAVPNETDADTAMAMLHSFGFSKFVEDFCKASGVHQAWNLLSLEPNLHKQFDSLTMWFEGTERPGLYRVCLLHNWNEQYIRRLNDNFKHDVDGVPIVVDFNPRYKDAPPPPDFRLLALHAICARVAHMSGATKIFEQMEHDLEELNVLAHDGSSCALLSHLLSQLS